MVMEFEDLHVTTTPEGVSLELVLAGLGSRFMAYLVDFLIQAVAITIVIVGAGVVAANSSDTEKYVLIGIASLLVFLIFFGYFVLFEMLDSGRSPGKRLAGLRVVRVGGGPIGLGSSVLRNIVRLIDMQPSVFYGIGCTLVLVTRDNQRLGDLLGGTLVIRERVAAQTLANTSSWNAPGLWDGTVMPAPGYPAPGYPAPGYPAPGVQYPSPTAASSWLPPEAAHWDVTAVSAGDIAIVRTFLANRYGYTTEARQRLGIDLAGRLWPKVAGPVAPLEPERFLELVAMVKSARG